PLVNCMATRLTHPGWSTMHKKTRQTGAAMVRDEIALSSPTPGTSRHLVVHRFGPQNGGKKVYLQAGLHADEWPGMLVLQHLMVLLEQAEQNHRLQGEVICVPFASPFGLAKNIARYLAGRVELSATGNFARCSGVLVTAVSQRVAGQLG